jgi:hypothetical protein
MSRATARVVMLLLLSAYCASAMRQPLFVVDPVDPTTTALASAVPQASVEIVPAALVAQEAVNPIQPATVAPGAVDPASMDESNVVLTPADAAVVNSAAATADNAAVSAQAVAATPPAVTAFAGKTLGIGYSGSGYLVS